MKTLLNGDEGMGMLDKSIKEEIDKAIDRIGLFKATMSYTQQERFMTYVLTKLAKKTEEPFAEIKTIAEQLEAEEGRDEKLYIKELQRKAKAGEADAQCKLALRYYYGDGVKEDCVKAAELFEKAAKKNSGEAWFYIGEYGYGGEFDDGEGWKTPTNEEFNNFEAEDEAEYFDNILSCYEKGAKYGYPEAAYVLATRRNMFFSYGPRERLKWLKRAAELGHPKALASLKIIYSPIKKDDRISVSLDYDKADGKRGWSHGNAYLADIERLEWTDRNNSLEGYVWTDRVVWDPPYPDADMHKLIKAGILFGMNKDELYFKLLVMADEQEDVKK